MELPSTSTQNGLLGQLEDSNNTIITPLTVDSVLNNDSTLHERRQSQLSSASSSWSADQADQSGNFSLQEEPLRPLYSPLTEPSGSEYAGSEIGNTESREHYLKEKEKITEKLGTPFKKVTDGKILVNDLVEWDVKVMAEFDVNGERVMHLRSDWLHFKNDSGVVVGPDYVPNLKPAEEIPKGVRYYADMAADNAIRNSTRWKCAYCPLLFLKKSFVDDHLRGKKNRKTGQRAGCKCEGRWVEEALTSHNKRTMPLREVWAVQVVVDSLKN